MDPNKYIVLYQGNCRFCNWCKDFVLRQTPVSQFEFIPIESEAGIKLIKELQLMITGDHPNSIVVLNTGFEPKYKWRACLEVMRHLSTPLKILRVVLLVIPVGLGNRMYDWGGRNRDLLCWLVGSGN